MIILPTKLGTRIIEQQQQKQQHQNPAKQTKLKSKNIPDCLGVVTGRLLSQVFKIFGFHIDVAMLKKTKRGTKRRTKIYLLGSS